MEAPVGREGAVAGRKGPVSPSWSQELLDEMEYLPGDPKNRGTATPRRQSRPGGLTLRAAEDSVQVFRGGAGWWLGGFPPETLERALGPQPRGEAISWVNTPCPEPWGLRTSLFSSFAR